MDNPFEQENRYSGYSSNYPPNPGPPPPLPNPLNVPPPPPRPPSTPYGSNNGYGSSYGQQSPYDNPYNPNPYDSHAHTPSPFDNPNSLYTNAGQIIGHSTPTPDPFVTPTSINHPSLYDPHVPYGGPSPSAASDRYNSPAPLPGQARVTSPSIPHPQNDFLNPSPAAAGGPRVHYEANDPNDGFDGDAPLLRRDGASTVTPVDGSSMRESYAIPGGFDPTLLNPDADENNIRYGRIPQRVPRRYKTKKRYESVLFRLARISNWR